MATPTPADVETSPHRPAPAASAPDGLQRATGWLYRWTAIVALIAITVLITADAVLRYVLRAPTSWIQEVVGLALFLLFCAGMPYSWYGRFHVRMDLVYERLPALAQRLIDVIGYLSALLFGGFLTAQAFLTVGTAYRTKTSMPSGDILVWPFAVLATVAFGLFCAVMLVSAVRRILR